MCAEGVDPEVFYHRWPVLACNDIPASISSPRIYFNAIIYKKLTRINRIPQRNMSRDTLVKALSSECSKGGCKMLHLILAIIKDVVEFGRRPDDDFAVAVTEGVDSL